MKRTIKGFITYRKCYFEEEPEINFLVFDPRGVAGFEGYVVVKTHEIEIEVPDNFDPRPELIKSLQEKQQKARADFEKLCTDIQRQISELQALEHSA